MRSRNRDRLPAMSRRILLIVHQEHSNPGRIRSMAERFGLEPVLCRPACGDCLPVNMDGYAAAVIFGGPMSANDDSALPFIREEIDWLEVPLRAGTPFLGVCLGAQLLARYLGGCVRPHPDGLHEIGYYPVRATAAGRDLFAREQHFYQWHGEGFSLPAGAKLLARGDLFENQAFRYGNAYGIQFHPEVTLEMMRDWTAKPVHRMVLPGAQARDRQLSGHGHHDTAVEGWLEEFFAVWLAGVNESERAVDASDLPGSAG